MDPRPPRTSVWRRHLAEWAVVIAVALVVAVMTRTYAAQTFFIPSGSMSPTLQVGDRIVVNKLRSTIHRGDIVVFRRVATDPQKQYGDLVKRVIGLPGQLISSRGETILVDGRPIAQPWLPRLTGLCSETAADIPRERIPAGHYFVMGDCRGNSYDSRAWGTVPVSHVIGKVVAIVWRNGHPWLHWF